MQNAFLVRLSISTWTARRMDKTATKEAKARAGASEKAGVRVYKSVIAADALDRIISIAGAARIDHQKRTVPWAYSGPGAITADGYPSYKAAMMQYEKNFNDAVAAFYAVYEQEREAARGYLGAMFNPADYPTTNSLRDKFSFNVHAEPLPQADAFRPIGLDPIMVEEIKRDIVDNNAQAMVNANNVAWSRVVEKVEMLRNRLREYTNGEVGKFYDSWLDNVSELITLIPSVNVADDQDLNRIARRLTALTAYTNEDLKASADFRAKVVKEAETILSGIDAAYKNAA